MGICRLAKLHLGLRTIEEVVKRRLLLPSLRIQSLDCFLTSGAEILRPKLTKVNPMSTNLKILLLYQNGIFQISCFPSNIFLGSKNCQLKKGWMLWALFAHIWQRPLSTCTRKLMKVVKVHLLEKQGLALRTRNISQHPRIWVSNTSRA